LKELALLSAVLLALSGLRPRFGANAVVSPADLMRWLLCTAKEKGGTGRRLEPVRAPLRSADHGRYIEAAEQRYRARDGENRGVSVGQMPALLDRHHGRAPSCEAGSLRGARKLGVAAQIAVNPARQFRGVPNTM
jgi:hypothetical protein